MSPDDARDRFSDAFEDALGPAEKAAFDRALEADRALADEYRAFCDALAETRALGRLATPRPSVDLLEGAKARLRKRMRGRFHRDAFADGRAPRPLVPLLALVVVLLLLGVAYAGWQALGELDAPPPQDGPADDGRSP